MLFDILENTQLSFDEKLILLVFMPAVILISLVLHECAHGLASYALGDPTAKIKGRLTLNPFKHLSLVGTLCMIFCGFGWAKPVPVDPRYYKNPKRGMAVTGLAGPAINLVIGLSALTVFSGLDFLVQSGLVFNFPVLKNLSLRAYSVIFNLLFIVYYYNLLLAVFNLMPVPPLDGSRLMLAFLPEKIYFGLMKYEYVIMIILFLLLWTGRFSFIFQGFVTLTEDTVYRIVWRVMNTLCRL